ncbi:UbiA prenyltransferase family protein [Kordia jejudonensis]|uniref:hypothetical protein n=1 Tax=Kordia jejudonensis TaxID=1348245 RepID=UPI0012E03CA9|nr:hypothetical protein [Kordia jejudonensis]
MKKLFNFYLDSSIHIALSVYALTYSTLLLFHLPYDEAVLYFTFYGTIVTYNFIKYGSSAKRYFFVASRYMKWIQLLSFVCFGLALFYAYYLQWETLLWAIGLSVLSSLYILPYLPNQKNFRTLPQFKILIVALCWTGVTVVLPLVNATIFELNQTTIFFMIQRMLLILILMIPFEICDLQFDAPALETLPQRIGVAKTKLLGYIWIVLFVVIEFWQTETFLAIFYSTIGLSVLLAIVVWQASIKKSKYFTSFWVESIPIVWFLVLLFS